MRIAGFLAAVAISDPSIRVELLVGLKFKFTFLEELIFNFKLGLPRLSCLIFFSIFIFSCRLSMPSTQ